MARISFKPSGGGAAVQTFNAECLSSDAVGKWVYIADEKQAGVYQVETVNPNNAIKVPAVGIIVSKPTTTTCVVQFAGLLEGIVTGLVPRQLIYVAADGSSTQSPPSVSYQQIVGAATDTDEILVRALWSDLPTPSYASHLGTQDGNSDARLPFPSGTLGRVSEPTTDGDPFYPYSKDGDWSDGADHRGTRSSSQTTTTPGDVTELDPGTTLRVRFLRYTSFGGGEVILGEETISCDGTDQTSTPNGYLETLSVGLNAGVYEGRVRVNVPLAALQANGGYLRTLVTHEGPAGGPYSDEWEIFHDTYGSPPTAGTPTVAENTPVLRYLSGIRFYDIGSTFDLSAGITSAFSSMFLSSPLLLDLGQLAISGPSSVNYTDFNVTPSHPPHPAWDDGFTWSDTLTLDVIGVWDTDAIIRARARDPFNTGGYVDSASGPIMVNTVAETSTRLDERFDDEDYRLVPQANWSSAPTTPPTGGDLFDSTAVLDNLTNDGLQVYNGKLIYPVTDFTTPASRRPVQDVAADYSVLTGTKDFQRPCKHGSSPSTRSNVVLYLPGFDVTTIGTGTPDIDPGGSGDTNLFIMIPGVSSIWFDCGREYFSAQFPTPEPGCIVKSLSGVAGGLPTNEYFYCTFGLFSTTPGDRTIVVRVEYRSAAAQELTRALAYNWN